MGACLCHLLCTPHHQVQGNVEVIQNGIATRLQKPRIYVLWCHILHVTSIPFQCSSGIPCAEGLGPAHTTSGWSICRDTRIPQLQTEGQGSNVPHLDVTTRHQPFQEGLPSDAFSELRFPRQVEPKGFPGCSQAGFLVGKCHPVAKCETLTARSLFIPVRQSFTQLQPVTCCNKANHPLPPHGASAANLHHNRFLRVPDFLASLGILPVASCSLLFFAPLTQFG